MCSFYSLALYRLFAFSLLIRQKIQKILKARTVHVIRIFGIFYFIVIYMRVLRWYFLKVFIGKPNLQDSKNPNTKLIQKINPIIKKIVVKLMNEIEEIVNDFNERNNRDSHEKSHQATTVRDEVNEPKKLRSSHLLKLLLAKRDVNCTHWFPGKFGL
jgi:hypothetical protein